MPCKYCGKLKQDHADEGGYVRSWCSTDINTYNYSYKFYEPLSNLEYLEDKYKKRGELK